MNGCVSVQQDGLIDKQVGWLQEIDCDLNLRPSQSNDLLNLYVSILRLALSITRIKQGLDVYYQDDVTELVSDHDAGGETSSKIPSEVVGSVERWSRMWRYDL